MCNRCEKELAQEDAMRQGDKVVCEDCLMDLMSPSKACDPWAVKLAKGATKTTAEAAASLQGLEKKLYEFVCARGQASRSELTRALEITPDQLDRAFAVLRHMELLRGQKTPDGRVSYIPFSVG